jgi:RNA polymerase sigma factor (sigma-70 family)
MTDNELLQDYVRTGSQSAFAELVRRHTDWIYCAAVRQVHEPSLAEDVVQAVFIVLAEKAKNMSPSIALNQWLFQVTRYSSIHALRDEARRRQRERLAVDLSASTRSQSPESADDWNQIVDRLDAATARLPKADQRAVLLRFYERKSMAEVGLALGVSEDAAKKRVAKAIGRLRGFLSAGSDNSALPAADLGTMLLAHTTNPAPVALTKSLADAAATNAFVHGTSGPAVTIASGAIHMMFTTNVVRVAGIAMVAVVPVGLIGMIVAVGLSQTAPATSSAQIAAATTTPSTTPGEAPYVQAIRLVKKLTRGSDAGRIDANAPLDASTGAFLDRNTAIFDLVHAGAIAHSTDWGVGTGDAVDVQHAIDQLKGERPLASLKIMRARQRWSTQDFSGGQQDLMDALALDRNVSHDHQILVVTLVQVSIEQMVLTQWAKLLPATPAQELANLPDQINRLADPPSMAAMIRAEHTYSIHQAGVPAGVADSMTSFYDTIAASLDQNPTPTQEAFQKMLDDGIAKTGSPQIRQLMAQNIVPSLARAYGTVCAGRATRELFMTGIAVVRDGESAVSHSVDPFGNGPFEYVRTPRGFQLRSKLTRDGKQITLDFGM